MQSHTPYTYIQCPCADPSSLSNTTTGPLSPTLSRGEDEEEDAVNFDPRAPRSNFSLFPLEYLLYCEDCHQIRCPRCVIEEIVSYYCPNCLFEVPSSNFKSEGNRCTRSCFQCPICVGPLTVTSVEPPPPSPLGLSTGDARAHTGTTYVLSCTHCAWSSTELGIKFDKPSGIYTQLAKLQNGGKPKNTGRRDISGSKMLSSGLVAGVLAPPISVSSAPEEEDSEVSGAEGVEGKAGGGDPQAPPEEEPPYDPESHFAALKSFYQTQLSASTDSSSLSALAELGFSSPGSLSRIMSLYSGDHHSSGHHGHATGSRHHRTRLASKTTNPNASKEEPSTPSEGLHTSKLDESAQVSLLRQTPWSSLSSTPQNQSATSGGAGSLPTRHISSLRPSATLLRAKRSKRCPAAACRHIISKPEPKIQNVRFRIRLVATSYIPSISLTPMPDPPHAPPPTIPSSLQPYYPPEVKLDPLRPTQFLLTFKNPLFEPVKVTLATPATTPGRFQSKVTVLCPQFEIGANTDVWDEALTVGTAATAGGVSTPTTKTQAERRRSTPLDIAAAAAAPSTPGAAPPAAGSGQSQPEAGKIYAKHRNSVTIVLEVIPSSVRPSHISTLGKTFEEVEALKRPLAEDEDVLEIPMFVRLEWEVDDSGHDGDGGGGHHHGGRKGDGGGGGVKERRELAYWSVLGIGRIKQT